MQQLPIALVPATVLAARLGVAPPAERRLASIGVRPALQDELDGAARYPLVDVGCLGAAAETVAAARAQKNSSRGWATGARRLNDVAQDFPGFRGLVDPGPCAPKPGALTPRRTRDHAARLVRAA